MSDLVGNPEDQFSRVVTHVAAASQINEPPRGKTNNVVSE